MNCRQCGCRIPEKLIKAEGFRCPECGKMYRLKTTRQSRVPSKATVRKHVVHTNKTGFFSVIRNMLNKKVWKFPVWAYLVVLVIAMLTPSGDSPQSDMSGESEVIPTTVPAAADVTAMPVYTPMVTNNVSSMGTMVPGLDTEVPLAVDMEVPEPSETEIAPEATEVSMEAQVIQIGDSGEKVKKLQERLIELGYLSGRADGVFGNSTKAAVEAYQKDARLPVTGVCDYDTYTSMTSKNAPSRERTKSNSSESKEEMVWVAPKSGKKYHVKNCRTLDGAVGVKQISLSKAKKQGYTACGVCG